MEGLGACTPEAFHHLRIAHGPERREGNVSDVPEIGPEQAAALEPVGELHSLLNSLQFFLCCCPNRAGCAVQTNTRGRAEATRPERLEPEPRARIDCHEAKLGIEVQVLCK